MIPWLMTACFYPCIIGPEFWGLVSKHWRMCALGKMQSPINIDPSTLLYDPALMPVDIDKHDVDAVFDNLGQLPLLTINDSKIRPDCVNISNGPVFPYRYRLHHIASHFGQNSKGEKGSEHTIDRMRFPAEIQLMAYNADLYENFTDAMTKPHGLLAISIIVDIGKVTNSELRRLTIASQSIKYKGNFLKSFFDLINLIARKQRSRAIIKSFNPYGLMPPNSSYMTYSGSLTFPGCYETVTWVIMNNPIYITKEDLEIWNNLQQTDAKQTNPVSMAHNYRPLKPLNGRLVRTNINIKFKVSLFS
ncbi:unnamed protein product [Dracunculus medinensis]|uniref:Alpha-carbonic anhydrase domain-containing protein n=1 Tax=Dracunculus medinensis TaxID=318479 RepID=A0A0N4UNQ6_DRAME|nr:unnamed protein product [Dracunculus medinensis]